MNQQFPIVEKTLKDYRYRLPIGIILPDGERLIDFTLHDFTGYHERLLGNIEDREKQYKEQPLIYAYRVFSAFLSSREYPILETVEGYTLNELLEILDVNHKQFFDSLYVADILSLILNIQVDAYGSDLRLGGTCPCPRKVKMLSTKSAYTPNLLSSVLYTLPSGKSLGSELRFPNSICPPMFASLPKFYQAYWIDDLPYYQSWLVANNIMDEKDFDYLPEAEKVLAEESMKKALKYGIDRTIEQRCPECDQTIITVLHDGNEYEFFYCSILTPSRNPQKPEQSVSEIIDQQAFNLTVGEQAPFSGVEEIYRLSPQRRRYFLKLLSETYEKQSEEIKKSQASNKRK